MIIFGSYQSMEEGGPNPQNRSHGYVSAQTYLQAMRVPSSNVTRQAALRYRLPAHPSHGPHGSQSAPICRTVCGNFSVTGAKYRDSYRVQSAIESVDTTIARSAAGRRSRANSTSSSSLPRPLHEYRPISETAKSRMTREWSDVMYTRFESTGSAMPNTTSFRPTAEVLPEFDCSLRRG